MADPRWPGILDKAGSQVLYREAAGLEKALADIEGERLLAIYGELARDQWDPQRIAYRNLPYLAWAVGVNLWEDDWPEAFRRWWVEQQWTLKQERGSELGLRRFISAVGHTVKRVIRPPATCYALGQVSDVAAVLETLVPDAQYYGSLEGNSRYAYENIIIWQDTRDKPTWAELMEADNAAYVARFPQLRVYAYTPTELMPWLCYTPKPSVTYFPGMPPPSEPQPGEHVTVMQRNGAFLGPLRPLYPTHQATGGAYRRTATLWDRGVETQLTIKQIARISVPDPAWTRSPGIGRYDEQVLLPSTHRACFLAGKFLGGGFNYGLFLSGETTAKVVNIPRSAPMVSYGKAQYQTVVPGDDLINLYPKLVSQHTTARPTELYASRGQFLANKFLPRSDAWKYLYEVWYIFDADRVPDYRKAGVYVGHARLGIPNYTAEALVQVKAYAPRHLANTSGYLMPGNTFLTKPDREPINKLCRAARASMAVRDTVLLDTAVTRVIQVRDLIDASGRLEVGQWIEN